MHFACSSKSSSRVHDREPDGSGGSDGGSSSGGNGGTGGTATGGAGGAGADGGTFGGASGLGGTGGTSASDAAAADAGEDAAPVIRPPTNPVLFDDFEDGVTNTTLWMAYGDSSATYQETGGYLLITLSNASGDHYAGYYSASSFDLSGRAVAIGIIEVPNIDAPTANGIGIDFDTSYGAQVATQDSTLKFMFRDGPN